MSRRRFMDRPNDLPSLDAKYDSESGNYYVNGSSSQNDINITDTIVQFNNENTGTNAVVEIKANENLLVGTSNTWSWQNEMQWLYFRLPFKPVINRLYKASFDAKISTELAKNNFSYFRVYFRGSTGVIGEACQNFDIENVSTEYTRITFNNLTLNNIEDIESASDFAFEVVGTEDWNDTDYMLIKNVKLEYADLDNDVSLPSLWIPNPADNLPMPTYEVTRCGKNLLDLQSPQYNVGYNRIIEITDTSITVQSNIGVLNNYKSSNLLIPQCFIGKELTIKATWDGYIENKGGIRVQQTSSNGLASGQAIETYNSDIPQSGIILEKEENKKLTYMFCSNVTSISPETPITYNNPLLYLGEDENPIFETYQGSTYTVTVNEPCTIPLLDGINTIFTDEEVELTVISQPTPDYPQPIIQNIPAGQYMINVKSENLFKPLSTPKSDTSYWRIVDNYCTPLENGWIRIDCDNMEGQSKVYADFWTRMEAMPRIKPNTTYKIVLEIKNFNFIGNSAYLALFDTATNTTPWINSAIFRTSDGALKNDKKVFSKKTQDIFPNNDTLTRNFVEVAPNTKINFDVRLSIYEENSTIETYQPYIEPQKYYVRLTDSLKSLSASIYDKIWINPNSKSKWIERRINQDLFDGSENWEFFTDKNKTFRCFMGQIIGMDRPGYNERFKLIGHSSFDIENGFYDIYSNAYIISLITVDSVEDFKQWLSTHNLTAQYQIQTPIIEDL